MKKYVTLLLFSSFFLHPMEKEKEKEKEKIYYKRLPYPKKMRELSDQEEILNLLNYDDEKIKQIFSHTSGRGATVYTIYDLRDWGITVIPVEIDDDLERLTYKCPTCDKQLYSWNEAVKCVDGHTFRKIDSPPKEKEISCFTRLVNRIFYAK